MEIVAIQKRFKTADQKNRHEDSSLCLELINIQPNTHYLLVKLSKTKHARQVDHKSLVHHHHCSLSFSFCFWPFQIFWAEWSRHMRILSLAGRGFSRSVCILPSQWFSKKASKDFFVLFYFTIKDCISGSISFWRHRNNKQNQGKSTCRTFANRPVKCMYAEKITAPLVNVLGQVKYPYSPSLVCLKPSGCI